MSVHLSMETVGIGLFEKNILYSKIYDSKTYIFTVRLCFWVIFNDNYFDTVVMRIFGFNFLETIRIHNLYIIICYICMIKIIIIINIS